jgi:hypothetical protein
MFFNDRRALKAANGPSFAPKGYKPDTAGRAAVHEEATRAMKNPGTTRKEAYDAAVVTPLRNDINEGKWANQGNPTRKRQ